MNEGKVLLLVGGFKFLHSCSMIYLFAYLLLWIIDSCCHFLLVFFPSQLYVLIVKDLDLELDL